MQTVVPLPELPTPAGLLMILRVVVLLVSTRYEP